MKLSLLPSFSALALSILGAIYPWNPSLASIFGQQDVEQEKFIPMAAPIGTSGDFKLMIVEQVSATKACWQETPEPQGPIQVQPLLLGFDFTGICRRSLDSNAYSIRVNGEDLGLRYALRLVEREGDLLLLGIPFDRREPELILGRTDGVKANHYLKINLDPSWRLARRTYQEKELGHLYLTTTAAPEPTVHQGGEPAPIPPLAPAPGGLDLTQLESFATPSPEPRVIPAWPGGQLGRLPQLQEASPLQILPLTSPHAMPGKVIAPPLETPRNL